MPFRLTASFVLLTLASQTILAQEPPRHAVFEDKLLVTVPEEYEVGKHGARAYISPAGGLAIHISKKKGSERFTVVVNGSSEAEYDIVSDFTFSPDGRSYAYSARTQTGKKSGNLNILNSYIVINGKPSQAYWQVSPPAFSPDSQTVAYQARVEDKWFVVAGSQSGERFTRPGDKEDSWWINPKTDAVKLLFSPDSKSVAYVAKRPDTNQPFVVLGKEKVCEKYENSDSPTFSPDSKRFAYRAWTQDSHFIVVDGVELGPYADVSPPAFSPDGREIAFCEYPRRGPQRIVVGSGRDTLQPKLSVPDATGYCFNLTFSRDGKLIAYRYLIGSRKALVIRGDTKGAVYEQVGDLSFLADSKTVVYWAASEGKYSIVVGDNKDAPFDYVSVPLQNPQGTSVAYAGWTGKNWTSNKACVVLNSKRGEDYDTVGQLTFDPAGTKVAYGAVSGRELWVRVLADGEGKPLVAPR